MRILVTGGAGFLGRNFVKRFLFDGHSVVVVDNMSSGLPLESWEFDTPKDNSKFGLMIGDCRSFFYSAPPGSLWAPSTFDLVVHCAAIVGGRLKIEGDPLAVATDLAIDADFFNWVSRDRRTPKVIYFSSSAIYPLELQTKEKHVALAEAFVDLNQNRWSKPDLSYGFVKFAGEYLAKFAAEKHNLNVAIYRPFGGYSEAQSLDYPFPSIVKRVVDGEDPVAVWASGDQERDFVHVDDVVSCVVETCNVVSNRPLNIGTGVATSFFSLAEQIVQISGKDLSVRNNPLMPGGVFSRVADTFEMNKLYTPKISLTEGIKRGLDRARKAV